MILHATEDSRIAMQEKMGSKVVLEGKGSGHIMSENEIRAIRDRKSVV